MALAHGDWKAKYFDVCFVSFWESALSSTERIASHEAFNRKNMKMLRKKAKAKSLQFRRREER